MALELQNEMNQEIHHDNMSIHASNRLAEGQLRAKEQTQQMKDELHTGMDSYATAKGLYTGYQVMSNVSQAGGVSKFAAQELGKTKAFAEAKVAPVQAAYGKVSDAIASSRSGFTPGQVSAEGTGLQHGVPVGEDGAVSKTLSLGEEDDVADAYSGDYNLEGKMTNFYGGQSQGIDSAYMKAPTEGTPDVPRDMSVVGDVEGGDDTLFDSANRMAKNVGGMSAKALGAAGGALDVVEDIAHGGLYGNNLEKAGNVVTIASTVLDFVPGLEWLGALGGIAATGLSVAGDAKDKKADAQQDQDLRDQTDAPTEQTASLAQRGGVSQQAQDSSHQIQGSSTF